MSPRSVDHRTDLWACAVVTYACLLGQLPFVGETIGALSIAVHKGQFTPPSGVTSLRRDRRDKLAIYARAGIPSYWIVNIPDRVLEVHVEPRGDVYARKNTSAPGDEVALLVDGRGVGRIAIATLLP